MSGEVIDRRCLNCEKRIGGIMIKLDDGEVHVTFPMCKICHTEILKSKGPMDNETARRLLNRMKERGIIDDYDWDVIEPKPVA